MKKRKDICPNCGKTMEKEYEDCMFCGGGLIYICECGTMCDIDTGDEM